MTRVLFAGLACCALYAQKEPPAKPARMEGRVINDSTKNPLRRANITLHSLEGGISTITVDADDHGEFAIRDIPPGQYSIEVSRDGYLSANVGYHGALRMPVSFYLGAGDTVTDVTFRLRPWGVLAGKIRYDDGEPGVGLRVEIYRSYRVRGRKRYQLAVTAGTDDRGQYRIYGLPPGNYYVAAIYEKSPSAPQRVVQRPVDRSGKELPLLDYTTTFFPDTTRLDEAVSVHVAPAEEVGGVDIFLKQVSRVNIRGHVSSGLSGKKLQTAAIMLYRFNVDSQSGMATPWRASFDRDGDFLIRDVPPGNYQVVTQATDTGTKLEGEQSLLVSNEDIDNLDLFAGLDATWKGELVIDGTKQLPPNSDPHVRIEARSEFHGGMAPNVENHVFSFPMAEGETYDVFVDNLPEDFYVAGVSLGGSDLRAAGITPTMASQTPLKVTISSGGAQVSGRAFGPDGQVWSGASLALLPEFALGSLQSYRFGSADEYGIFHIRGVAPGKYTMIAYYDDPPCDFYDSTERDLCRTVGAAVDASAGGEQLLELRMKAPRK